MTDIINKIIKEYRERFVKSAFTDEQDTYYVQCDAQELESFLTLSLEKAILEAREEGYQEGMRDAHKVIGVKIPKDVRFAKLSLKEKEKK